ncbi:hypothetical protein FVB9288_00065 [Flavobacterium sp. CECT 9288]|uniref:vitamin K epoxide reductase family protein n=1 Tax=Flavobacterium sp. CECT 9288 TaxID=2845819 RepID=UPI001E34F7CC|nr:vitamin K epoxide reductase family protein [Flavobacterium sp. CECT 9288]CAH0334482.1 hypothetical protein FVB9288_00065 [Flavobacterium sp. CECT 9288]
MLNIIKKYLNLNKYYNQKELFEEAFLSHPNYPSLYAVTDTLSYLSIDNLAVKIPKEQFIELPEYFLTMHNGELVLTKKENSSVLIENEKGKRRIISSDEFLKEWSQIVVIIGSNIELNNIKIKNGFSKWVWYLLPVVLLVSLSLSLFNFSALSFSMLGLTIMGLLASVLILQEKFGIKTEIGSKLCNVSAQASCESVIKSKKSEIFKGLSFYDLPILFFGTNFLALLIDPINSSSLIVGLSLISIPFLGYSVWLQKVTLKKWCFLCLLVSVVILAQGMLIFLNLEPFNYFTLCNSFAYVISSILITSSWFFIRPIMEENIMLKDKLNVYKRLKRNFKVFKSFSKKVEVVEGFEKLKGIQYGDSNATISLTLFLSPSCGHCHKAFQDALDLFQKNKSKVYLNILFNVNPENSSNEYLSVVETLLVLNTSNEEVAKEALVDWHIKNMSLIEWKVKWSSSSFDKIVNDQMIKQYEWCLVNNFNFTPVKIVNGELFPDEYELTDIKYFLNDFEEERQTLKNK